MSKIHLHINHLSLPGYSLAERRAFIAALEQEVANRRGNAKMATSTVASTDTMRVTSVSSQPTSQAQAIARALIKAPAVIQNAVNAATTPIAPKPR